MTNILIKKESYVIALNFDLEANSAQKVIILHVLRNFVNKITSLSNHILVIFLQMSFLNVNKHFNEKRITCHRFEIRIRGEFSIKSHNFASFR